MLLTQPVSFWKDNYEDTKNIHFVTLSLHDKAYQRILNSEKLAFSINGTRMLFQYKKVRLVPITKSFSAKWS
jgi:hypothetical protein